MKVAEKQVSYFYDEEIGNFCYGGGNPMRPHRARMTYGLVDSYGLSKKLSVHRPRPRTFEELTAFHADEYINFLRSVTPNTVEEHMTQLRRFNMGIAGEADCPVFDGLYEYCSMYAGGSVDGAALLSSGKSDVALNWSGGMHHAKKAEASGFCYVNDIVMAILELLKTHARVLYVDIDIHHGDGVEEAFYLTDRVMTVSFHKYGEFFPGTGALDDVGYGKGKYYTVNVPLKDGMDDDSYKLIYEPVMQKVMEMYQPGAIVMCCGADSLSGDRLGCFNLSLEGHSNCLEFLLKFGVPLLVLGGGGYTLRNVARCWCYETGRMMGIDLPDNLPEAALNEYNFYLDTQRLRIAVSNMKNANERAELEDIRVRVLEHLSQLPPVPSAQMQYVPPKLGRVPEAPEEDPDVRGGGQVHDELRRVKDEESDDENDYSRQDELRRHQARVEQGYQQQAGLPLPQQQQQQQHQQPAEVVMKHDVQGGGAAPMEGMADASGYAAATVHNSLALNSGGGGVVVQQQQPQRSSAEPMAFDPSASTSRPGWPEQQQQQPAVVVVSKAEGQPAEAAALGMPGGIFSGGAVAAPVGMVVKVDEGGSIMAVDAVASRPADAVAAGVTAAGGGAAAAPGEAWVPTQL